MLQIIITINSFILHICMWFKVNGDIILHGICVLKHDKLVKQHSRRGMTKFRQNAIF